MKKKIIVALSVALLATAFTGCSASFDREIKSMKSDFTGGLDRTLTVYDYNGGKINSWEGKFDVSESENEVYFDINGKRVIIHGGIVINEEK